MTVSACYGSNLFNLCISLGLPWLVAHVLTGQPIQPSNRRLVAASSLIVLLTIFVAACLLYNGMVLRRSLGAVFLVVYALTMMSVGTVLLVP